VDELLERAATQALSAEEIVKVKASIRELSTTRFLRPENDSAVGSSSAASANGQASTDFMSNPAGRIFAPKRKRGTGKPAIEEKKGMTGLKTALEKLGLLKIIKAKYRGEPSDYEESSRTFMNQVCH
jgi:hypothetical protein